VGFGLAMSVQLLSLALLVLAIVIGDSEAGRSTH
jgi:hypothetical protein